MTNKEHAQSAPTRQEKQQESQAAPQEGSQKKKRVSRFRKLKSEANVRLVPIWARILIVFGLLGFSAIAGLLVGYALIGEGESFQVLSIDKWQSLIDFIQGE